MQNNKIFSFCNIYIFLWIVYGLQSIIFGSYGTIYSRLVLAFLLTTSVYYFVYAIRHYKMSQYMKGLGWLVLMFTVYGVLIIIEPRRIGGTANYVYLQYIYNSILPIYPFYVFARKGTLNINNLKWWTVLFFVVATIQYFHHQQERLSLDTQGRDEFTNNFGYDILSLIPLLAFFSNRKIVQYVGLGYAMVFILLSMKRGAILIGVICVIWFLYSSMKNTKNSSKFVVVILSLITIVIGYFFVQYLMTTSDYFNYRLERTMEGDSSGRDDIYSTLWRYFVYQSDPASFLFGNGAKATIKIIGQYAHNDWLELAINQGVLGIFLYIVYWRGFYRARRKAKFNEDIFLAISLLFIINFIRSFFSMSYGDMSRYTTLCIGYCMGMISERERQIRSKQILS